MSTTKKNLQIKHDLIGKIFFLKAKGGNAELHYERHGDSYLDLISTTVPAESRGFGIGTLLIEEALEFAAAQHLKVKPTCVFVNQYITKHSEYHYLLV